MHKFINFELIKFYTSIFEDLMRSNCSAIEIIDSLYTMNYEIFISKTQEFISNKDNIKIKFKSINQISKEYIDIYSFYFIKFIFKKIYNEKLDCKNEFQLPTEYKSQIPHYYKNDNFMNIIYHEENFKIIKASKNYIDCVNKDISFIFPDCFREYYRNKFKHMIKKANYFDIEQDYIIFNKKKYFQNNFNNNNSEHYLDLCKFNCKIYPSLDLNQLLITIKVQKNNIDLIVFEEDFNNSKTYLKDFSESISKQLGLNANLMVKTKKIEISFSEIFNIKKFENTTLRLSLKNSETDEFKREDKDSLNSIDIYNINYDNFEIHFLKFIEKLEEKELITYESKNELHLNFQKIKNSANHLFYIIEKFEPISNKFTVYKIKKYHNSELFKEVTNPLTMNTNKKIEINHEEEKDSITSINSQTDKISKNKISQNLDIKNDSQNHNWLSKEKNFNSTHTASLFHEKIKHGYNFKTLEALEGVNRLFSKQTKLLTKILFISIGFLFINFIIILVVITNKLGEVYILFKLHLNFTKLSHEFYSTMLNLNQMFLLYSPESTDKSSYADNYYYKKFNDKGINLDIPLYINIETQAKIDHIHDLMQNVEGLFLNSGNKNIVEDYIFKKNIKNYFVSTANSKFKVSYNEVSFFENLYILLSTAKIIVSNPENFTYLYIIDISNGNYDFKNFYEKNISLYQKNAINIVINLVNLIKIFDKSNVLLDEIFELEFINLKILIYISFAYLILINLVIIILIAFMIKGYKNLLIYKILVMDFFLEDGKDKILKIKLNLLKIAIKLYEKDPFELFFDIKQQKLELKEKNNNIIFSNNFNCKKNNVYNDKKFNNLFENACKDNPRSEFKKLHHYKKGNSINLEGKKNINSIKNEEELKILEVTNKINKDVARTNKKNIALQNLSKTKSFKIFEKIILFFFLFFVLYFLIFTLLNTILNQTNLNNEIFLDDYSDITFHTQKNSLLMNTILLLNMTEDNLKNLLSTEHNLVSYEKGFRYFDEDLQKLMKTYKNNKYAQSIEPYFYDYIDCNYLYSDFYNDELLRNIKELYIERNLTDVDSISNLLKKICMGFSYTKEKNIFLLYNNLLRSNRYIYEKYSHGKKTYFNIKNIYDSSEFLDFYMFIILVLRPIRIFINNNLIESLIIDVFNFYKGFIIFNLVFCLAIEFFFLYLVWKFINNGIKEIDRNLFNFIRCLEF